jgi:hypothetical protein
MAVMFRYKSAFGAALAASALSLLSACAPSWPRGDWSGDAARLLHKTEFLRFVAPADCATPRLFNPAASDAAFSKVIDLRPIPGRPWTYDLTYIAGDGARRERYDVLQWWTGRGTRLPPTATQQSNCVLLVDIPRSSNPFAERPYHGEDPKAKAAEYQKADSSSSAILLIIVLVLSVLVVVSSFGFEDSPKGDVLAFHKFLIAFGCLVAWASISLVTAYACIEMPWQSFQKVAEYYRFFDDLPRRNGHLLPIPASDFYYILAGPPSPNETQFKFAAFLWITAVLGAAWLIIMLPPIVRGAYWLLTPLPLEQLHRQALAEGRTPTGQEVLAAVHAALAGKSAWQLRIMQRKAELFAERFGYRVND